MYNNYNRPRPMGDLPPHERSVSADDERGGAERERPEPNPSYHNGFTVMTPNEQKRNHVLRQAQRGEEQYQRHIEQKKLGTVSCGGMLGGGQVSQTEARRNVEREHRVAKMESLQKRQQYRDEQKRREEEEIQKKKDEQRRKAELNKMRDRERQERLASEHERAKEGFLAQLERRNRSAQMTAYDAGCPSESPQSRYSAQSHTMEREPYQCRSTEESRLQVLVRAFPGYDRETLRDLLLENNGSVDGVISLLTG